MVIASNTVWGDVLLETVCHMVLDVVRFGIWWNNCCSFKYGVEDLNTVAKLIVLEEVPEGEDIKYALCLSEKEAELVKFAVGRTYGGGPLSFMAQHVYGVLRRIPMLKSKDNQNLRLPETYEYE